MQPHDAIAGEDFIIEVVVAIVDSSNNVVPNDSVPIAVELAAGPAGATLSGTTTRKTSAGVAHFRDLSIDQPGNGYRLSTFVADSSGTDPSLPAVSTPFTIYAAPIVTFQHSMLSTGGSASCALDTELAAWCWGNNTYGELGDGITFSIPTPTPVVGGLTFSQIDAFAARVGIDGTSQSFVCGLTTGGVAHCWGAGSVNNGRPPGSPQPVPDLPQFTAISTGGKRCGLTAEGVVWCWSAYAGATRVLTDLRFKQISTGWAQACALTAAGAAYCWGRPFLGNGSTDTSATPVAVAGGHTFERVRVGASHTCALDTDGYAWCWGGSSAGALGNGDTTTIALVPTRVSGNQRFIDLSAGDRYTCAITTAGQAMCWGYNASGELGDGSTISHATPTAVAGGHTFAVISVRQRTSCALTAAGEAWCWGSNFSGELGDGSRTMSHTPVRVAGTERFATISAGGVTTCAVTLAGEGRCWGSNTAGQLADGHPLYSNDAVRVVGNHTFISITQAANRACGLTANHETWCWGMTPYEKVLRSVPTRLPGDPGFEAVSVGWGYACGIDGSHTGWCWGSRDSGGGGTGGYGNVPEKLAGDLKLAAIAVGHHACALTTAGDAYCWFGGRFGYAGEDPFVPQLIGGGLKFVALTGAWDADCGLTATGEAYCWGFNGFGELGDGTTTSSTTPRAVLGGLRFTQISSGSHRSCGITPAGKAYCWGDNLHNPVATPLPVPGDITFTEISTGHSGGTCGVANTGTVYCWDLNQRDPKEVGGGLKARTP